MIFPDLFYFSSDATEQLPAWTVGACCPPEVDLRTRIQQSRYAYDPLKRHRLGDLESHADKIIIGPDRPEIGYHSAIHVPLNEIVLVAEIFKGIRQAGAYEFRLEIESLSVFEQSLDNSAGDVFLHTGLPQREGMAKERKSWNSSPKDEGPGVFLSAANTWNGI